MYKRIIIFFITFLRVASSQAQDIITKRNGEEIRAKVLEISDLEIRYKNFDYLTGPTIIVPKNEVFSIKYENGQKELFEVTAPSTAPAPSAPSNQGTAVVQPYTGDGGYEKGQKDAEKFYTKYKDPATGSLASGFCCGIIGIAVPLISVNSEIKETNLGAPDPVLMTDPNYRRGYVDKAKSIKRKKVWNNYIIGCGAAIVWNIIYLVATN